MGVPIDPEPQQDEIRLYGKKSRYVVCFQVGQKTPGQKNIGSHGLPLLHEGMEARLHRQFP